MGYPFGNKPKVVYQYDLTTGKLINKYDSLTEATKELRRIRENANIVHLSNCCNGKTKSAYGFLWTFKERKGTNVSK